MTRNGRTMNYSYYSFRWNGLYFKLYGQPAGIFEDYVSAGRKKLVIGWYPRGHVVPEHKNKSIRGLIYYTKSQWYGRVGRLSHGQSLFFVIIKNQKVRVVQVITTEFYNVKNESSIIMSKSSSKNLSNENKECCFWCLQDKTWIKMPIL